MALAIATIIQTTRDILGDDPWLTRYTGSTTTGTETTYTVPDGTRWDEGAIMEWQDGGEQDWVASVAGNVATVYPAINGTTEVAHTAGATIVRDPTFTYKRIQDSIELTLQELFPQVYKVSTLSLTPSSTQTWYDLAADFIAPIRVQQLITTNNDLISYGGFGSKMPVGVAFVPTTLCASGVGMYFRSLHNVVNPILVTYQAKITAGTSSNNYTDLSSGLLQDIVAWGAASRLMLTADSVRATQEDIQMGDSSVQVGMRSRVARDVQKTFLDLKSVYAEELLRNNAPMSTGFSPGVMSQSYTINAWY